MCNGGLLCQFHVDYMLLNNCLTHRSVRRRVGTVAKKIKVGVFGRTGVGKSFLINTILGENLLPSGSGSACTSVIIQVAANTLDPNFIAEIEFISKEVANHFFELLKLILSFVSCHRQGKTSLFI